MMFMRFEVALIVTYNVDKQLDNVVDKFVVEHEEVINEEVEVELDGMRIVVAAVLVE